MARRKLKSVFSKSYAHQLNDLFLRFLGERK